MMIINDITVDLAKWEELPQIDMKQFDSNTRAVRVTLLAEGEPWVVPEGVTCSVAYFKDGEQLGWYDALPDGTAACTVEGNVVTAVLAPEVLALPGFETVSVQFQNTDLDQLGTFSFLIWSEPNLAAGTNIGNVYYSVANLAQIDTALREMNERIGNLEEGEASAGGGYYTIHMTQTDADTVTVDYEASSREMPEVEPQELTLPGGGGTLCANLVEPEDGGNPTLDRTFAEISEAYLAGKYVYASLWGGELLVPLVCFVVGEAAVFCLYVMGTAFMLELGADDALSVSMIPAQETLPNPYTLTFTGAVEATYNGAKAVTVEIPVGSAGADGKDGADGEDGVGILSIAKTSTSGLVDTYTITLTDGSTSTFTVTNGADGADGADGQDGQDGADGSGEGIPTYVQEEAARVAALVQSRQNENTVSFLVCSDLHYSTTVSNAAQQKESLTHMGQAMKLIRQAVHIDFAAMLGDMIWDGGETADQAMAAVRAVNGFLHEGFLGIPNFRTRGNHDCGYNSGAEITEEQIFANTAIFNQGAVYGEDRLGGYCYRDFEDQKLRVICLNSSETDSGGCLLTAEQVSWLASALDLTDKGEDWKSILLSHHPLDWGKDGGVSPIDTINGASGLLCTIHGHIHNFMVDAISGTEVKRIAIPNACFGRENEYTTAYDITYGEGTTYSKTAGTAKDTSFCVITVDVAAQKIYADHYGAGYDRVVDCSGPLDETAVMDGYRLSSDSPYYKAKEGYVISAYIPYDVPTTGVPGVIYVKGAQWMDTEDDRLYFFKDMGSGPLMPMIAGNSSGNNVLSLHYTMESLGDKYFKLTPVVNEASIYGNWYAIGVAAAVVDANYIRISLAGSAEDLVVSVDEPIE